MVQFKVGDTVTLCAALKPFCGELGSQFYIVHDLDCAVGSCPASPFPYTWDCLTPSGVSVEFQWTSYGYNNTCNPAYKLKSLGTATTNSVGMATIQYQITQNDLDIYNNYIGVFDLRVCFNNGGTENRIYSKARGKADRIIIVQNLCQNVQCPDTCFGADLWSMKCDPVTGSCVQDALMPNTPICTASHVIEYDWSFLPQAFLDLVTTGIVDISNVLGDYLPSPSNIIYKGATFSSGKFRVYVQYTPPTGILQLSLPDMALGTFASAIGIVVIMAAEVSIFKQYPPAAVSPWVWGVAFAIAVIGGVGMGYTIQNMFSGETQTGTAGKDAAGKTKDANDIMEADLARCLARFPCVTNKTCSVDDTILYDTCTKAAGLINKINTDAIAGTPSSRTQNEVEDLLQTYSDRQTALETGLITANEALDQIATELAKVRKEAADKLAAETCQSGQTYDPTVMKCVQTEADCWIPSLIPGGCILTAKTGKTVVTIGAVVIGAYVVFSLIKK